MKNQFFPRYMKMNEAMWYLNLKSYNSLHNFIDRGLPVTVINGIKRIDRVDADKFMEDHKSKEETK